MELLYKSFRLTNLLNRVVLDLDPLPTPITNRLSVIKANEVSLLVTIKDDY
ncbi:hypothetical protein PN465_06720 [Nodularia spumigena CS-584]|jgi:hypothetical protein|uniref:Uncharacterized protein n=1 Tax=Nodularia spumigena UHCC 0060 TaxID=3110300 RepID=A0ABU5UK43_NODSP|nr:MULTISPECIES: hypothetical protein [Cyanophyceae]MDB9356658.1 hypothetical protein [Nodularia spumigena CS-587/03]AHJ27577.1 hypothetical protein NSP_12370 [Nodularia spumigena CCY9414]MDB9305560.1 hypothetical protein [Nodularia spumigena CS-591/12]MDB9316609.1 hypothetical protein [Nodularia spumigena CS-590/01A]MDB9320844.1 hypothetical protein [Nodularia spumigena CS-591/07A]